jgi:deazaflavin-dependent oxidoreductase (nitroreductase family)
MSAMDAVKRATQRLTTTKGFRMIGPKVVPRLDRFVHRVTGGRVILGGRMIPSLVLTTTGARSGRPRTAPLATLPDDDGSFYVIGSNFGQEKHPAWTANLIANPEATVSYKGRTVPVKAHLLDAEEKAAVWPRLLELWPVYDRYVEISGRDLRVFHLVPR